MPNRVMDEEPGDENLIIRPLEIPHFDPVIPEDLIENLSKRDKHVVQTLSMVAQKVDFIIECVVSHNDALRSFERRIVKVEQWRTFVMSKWSLIAGAFVLFFPYIIPKLGEVIKKLF